MKVSELIEMLNKLNPQARVCCGIYERSEDDDDDFWVETYVKDCFQDGDYKVIISDFFREEDFK